MNDLLVIDQQLKSTISYLQKLMGPSGSLVINNELERTATLENISSLTALEKAVESHYAPEIEALYKPYKEKLGEKKEWMDAIGESKRAANIAVVNYNNIERARLDEIRRQEAEIEAQKQREALEAVKLQAQLSGNEEVVKEVEVQQQNIIVDYIPTTQVKAHSEAVTMSETPIIEEFQITDQLTAIQAMIDVGLGNLLKLDITSETAMKKHLVNNPFIKAMPGMYFRRGFRVNTKKK